MRFRRSCLLLSFLILVSTLDISTKRTPCADKSECSLPHFESGICVLGGCVCHPTYLPPGPCTTVRNSPDEPYAIKNFLLTPVREDCGKLRAVSAKIESPWEQALAVKLLTESRAIAAIFSLSYSKGRWRWSDGSEVYRNSWIRGKLPQPPKDGSDAKIQIRADGVWEISRSDTRSSLCQMDGRPQYVFHGTTANYSTAERTCRDAGMDVVSIQNGQELNYVRAMYLNANQNGWIGMVRSGEEWVWADDMPLNRSLWLPTKALYGKSSRTIVLHSGYAVVNETEGVPFICKTAPVARDCRVLKELNGDLESGEYRVRPLYNDFQVFCDMESDGGGYTYYINSAVQNAINSPATIKRFCRNFDPIDLISPTQVLSLAPILASRGVTLGSSKVVIVGDFRDGKYWSLSSRRDLTELILQLRLFNGVPLELRSPEGRGTMLGISSTGLVSFKRQDRLDIVAALCGYNNKRAPPESFSLNYFPGWPVGQSSTISYSPPSPLDRYTLCIWFNTTQTQGTLISLVDPVTDEERIISINSNADVSDGLPHRFCMVSGGEEQTAFIDGVRLEGFPVPSILDGVLNIGYSSKKPQDRFVGRIESVDIWDNVNESVGVTPSPLYIPGNVLRWSDLYPLHPDPLIYAPPHLFGYSRFKVGIGPSGLQMARQYCLATGGHLGAPADDYEYQLILKLLQGQRGWISAYRSNGTVFSTCPLTPSMAISYIPISTGGNGNLTVSEAGDLEPVDPATQLPFVCQFDVEEARPAVGQGCAGEVIETDKGRFSWVPAAPDSTVKIICPHGAITTTDQRYATRRCVAGNETGAAWSAPNITICRYSNALNQELENLGKVEVTLDNAIEIADKVLNITELSAQFDETGVNMVTGILEKLVKTRHRNSTTQLAKTLSNILEVNSAVLAASQRSESSADRLVSSVEGVAGMVGENATSARSLKTANLEISAGTGDGSDNVSLEMEDGSAKFSLPATASKDQPVFLVKYQSNKLFISDVGDAEEVLAHYTNTSLPSAQFINTAIITAGVQNTEISDLPTPLSFTMATLKPGAGSAQCVFYRSDGSSGGIWSSEGLGTVPGDKFVTCTSTHLTSFAVIMMMDPETHEETGVHMAVMTTLSYACIFVSLVGLLLTVLALSLQRSLWRLDMTKVHVWLSVSLFAGYITFLLGIDQTQSELGCLIAASLMHFFFLAAFTWMSIEAYTLYLQFVKVFPSYTPHFISKCQVVAILVPLAIAGGFLAAALSTDSVSTYYEMERYCWIRSNTLYYGFILPVLIIISANLTLFVYVARAIYRVVRLNKEDTSMSQGSVQVRAAVSVLVVLGVTWLVGAFTFGSTSIVFQYVFVILNGLQGFCIFLFHVLLKPEVRKRWYNSFMDISNSWSSNSHVLKSQSFHRAQKYQVQQLKGETTDLHGSPIDPPGVGSFSSAASNRPLIDKRFTCMSNSNEYATIESRPSSVSSGVSGADNAVTMGMTPLIKAHPPSTPPEATATPLKRPLSTVASLDIPSSPGINTAGEPGDSDNDGYSFSPVSYPESWRYNPLAEQDPLEIEKSV